MPHSPLVEESAKPREKPQGPLEESEMGKKLTGKALAKFETQRDVWQEVLDAVREVKAGDGKRTKIAA